MQISGELLLRVSEYLPEKKKFLDYLKEYGVDDPLMESKLDELVTHCLNNSSVADDESDAYKRGYDEARQHNIEDMPDLLEDDLLEALRPVILEGVENYFEKKKKLELIETECTAAKSAQK